jgi:hypothetical protein
VVAPGLSPTRKLCFGKQLHAASFDLMLTGAECIQHFVTARAILEAKRHCFRVHYPRMRNITLSAEEELIDQARLVARERHTTLNEAFREWLKQFTSSNGNVAAFDDLMDRLKDVNAGRHFTRDELNER